MAVFVRAADLGSFSAAAASLGMSAPMVGKHVRFLEDRLGLRLIQRTTRRQGLTDFGRAYYDRCRALLAEAEAVDALAADQLSEPRGRLRVTMPVHFGRRCVLPVLLELAERFPALELDLTFSDRLSDLAEDGYDFAVRTGVLANRAGLIARRIARQTMIVCASPAYLAAHGRPRTPDELQDRIAVVYRRSGLVAPWLFPDEDQAPFEVTPPYRFRLDDLLAIADAASDGAGVAWLPYWLVRDRIQSGALIRLLPDAPPFLYDCHAVWLQTPRAPLKVRVAVDALVERLPDLMT